MYRVYLSQQQRGVAALIVGPSASSSDLTRWTRGKECTGPSEFDDPIDAWRFAKDNGAVQGEVWDPGGLGILFTADLEKLIKPESTQ